MSTEIKSYKITTCDRCGRRTDLDPLAAWNQFMQLKGNMSVRSYDGSSGGGDVSYDFCSDCTAAFLNFMKEGE